MSLATIDVSAPRTQVREIPLWTNPNLEKRPKKMSFCLALILHSSFILLGGFAFVKPAEYGIEQAQGGMEIYMVAALPKDVSQGVEISAPPIVNVEKNEMEMAVPAPVMQQPGNEKSQEKTKHTRASDDPNHVGDGSSQVPGLNKTTFYSPGGGSTDERPGYLKNPAPPYPQEAIQLNQEGLVLLSVLVDRRGKPQMVTIKQSSGFSLLDESAFRTIKNKWKFSPGRLGSLSTESLVLVPIRFQLEDIKK